MPEHKASVPWQRGVTSFMGMQASPAMDEDLSEEQQAASTALAEAATACAGFSGRMLRKLPFLAHARGSAIRKGRPLSCRAFATQLRQASELEAHDRGLMK